MLSARVPEFWARTAEDDLRPRDMINYRRLWRTTVMATLAVAVLPLLIVTFIQLSTTQRAVDAEAVQRTHRFASNARRSVTSFLTARREALDFVIHDNDFDALRNESRLGMLLVGLKSAFGGFVDLGLIDASGTQLAYVGPFELKGAQYQDQPWFREVAERGLHVSEVFLGHRHTPHFVIAVKKPRPGGSFVVLRATIDTALFNNLLSTLHLSGGGDAYIINRKGILQTPSRRHGAVFDPSDLPVPAFSEKTRVDQVVNAAGRTSLVGHAHIPDSPFVLLVVSPEDALLAAWHATRVTIGIFVAVSVLVIIAVVLGVATGLVNRIYLADQRRLTTLHQVEYQNKMASIGRLAAGVAHEVNNPLAVINEKAGLLQDMMLLTEEYAKDDRLLGIAASIVASVERCGAITRRLLSFARRSETPSMEALDLEEVVHDVLGFLGKDAQHKGIDINICNDEDAPKIVSDRGKLQEIFLNLINNAFAAMPEGGSLTVTIHLTEPRQVTVEVADDGCGIEANDLPKVFEPFFSTRVERGGTGLGLSITRGLVEELGGRIAVKSKPGIGTTFFVHLPAEPTRRGEGTGDESSAG